jgi:hypothetical protein
MKKFGFATVAASGLVAAILGLAAPASRLRREAASALLPVLNVAFSPDGRRVAADNLIEQRPTRTSRVVGRCRVVKYVSMGVPSRTARQRQSRSEPLGLSDHPREGAPTYAASPKVIHRFWSLLSSNCRSSLSVIRRREAARTDFAGMMHGYPLFFGRSVQPNLPARSTVQVAGLASPGYPVEIEVTAVR